MDWHFDQALDLVTSILSSGTTGLNWLWEEIAATFEFLSRIVATAGVIIGALLAFWLQGRIRQEERTAIVEDQVLEHRRSLLVNVQRELSDLYDLVVRTDIAHKQGDIDYRELMLTFKARQVRLIILSSSLYNEDLGQSVRDVADKLQVAIVTNDPNNEESFRIKNEALVKYLTEHKITKIFQRVNVPGPLSELLTRLLTPVMKRGFYRKLESNPLVQAKLQAAMNHEPRKVATRATNNLSKALGQSIRDIDDLRLESTGSKIRSWAVPKKSRSRVMSKLRRRDT